MCWFVDDRSYKVPARLQANFYDVTDIHEPLDDDWALLPIPIYVEFDESSLDFLERADGTTDYVVSFLIPAGLIAKRTDEAEKEVKQDFLDQLGDDLVAKVHAERGRFDQNPDLGSFRVESDLARAVRHPDGTVSVEVPVHELDEVGALHRYEIRSHGEVLSRGDFTTVEADGRYWIRGSLPVEANLDFVTVRVEDASTRARSYTLPIQ
jgi:hypothetical protein